MTTTPNRPDWWTDHMEAAGDLARRAADTGGWPEPYRRPTDPDLAPAVEALAVLAGHALHRLDALDMPVTEAPDRGLGTELTVVALAEALLDRDTAAAEALLPTDLHTLRQVALDAAWLLLVVIERASTGQEREALAQMRAGLIANASKADDD